MDFVVRVYEISAGFPKEEKYGLILQLRNCAVSISSNISEGAGRATNKQFRYFLEISMGSINEALQIYKMILSFYNSLGNKD